MEYDFDIWIHSLDENIEEGASCSGGRAMAEFRDNSLAELDQINSMLKKNGFYSLEKRSFEPISEKGAAQFFLKIMTRDLAYNTVVMSDNEATSMYNTIRKQFDSKFTYFYSNYSRIDETLKKHKDLRDARSWGSSGISTHTFDAMLIFADNKKILIVITIGDD